MTTEWAEAKAIAERWLDFKMNPLVDMVAGEPDCAACILARQYLHALERLAQLGAARNLRGSI